MIFKATPNVALPSATGANVEFSRKPEPLQGAERDEIAALVSRIKQADARQRTQPKINTPRPTVAALDLAEKWQLPREVHEYFIIEAA